MAMAATLEGFKYVGCTLSTGAQVLIGFIIPVMESSLDNLANAGKESSAKGSHQFTDVWVKPGHNIYAGKEFTSEDRYNPAKSGMVFGLAHWKLADELADKLPKGMLPASTKREAKVLALITLAHHNGHKALRYLAKGCRWSGYSTGGTATKFVPATNAKILEYVQHYSTLTEKVAANARHIKDDYAQFFDANPDNGEWPVTPAEVEQAILDMLLYVMMQDDSNVHSHRYNAKKDAAALVTAKKKAAASRQQNKGK